MSVSDEGNLYHIRQELDDGTIFQGFTTPPYVLTFVKNPVYRRVITLMFQMTLRRRNDNLAKWEFGEMVGNPRVASDDILFNQFLELKCKSLIILLPVPCQHSNCSYS